MMKILAVLLLALLVGVTAYAVWTGVVIPIRNLTRTKT